MLYDKVLNTIKQNNLLKSGDTVIAAVSGGADSVCLLDILVNISEKLGVTVKCAHLNHNLRGAESDGDQEYVEKLCEKYGISIHIKSVDIASLSQGKSIEDVARRERYDFFKELCTSPSTYIATAHTVGDNTETFFINLLRGAGSRGLCGIPIKRENIIRPMLDVTRNEILVHLKKAGLSYRTDSTNSDTSYLRNFIRHEIIPVFENRPDINIHKSIAKATENLLAENKALDRISSTITDFDFKKLKELDDAVLYRVLTKKLEKEQGIILDSNHYNAVKFLLYSHSTKVQIKGDIYAVNNKGVLEFCTIKQKNTQIYPLQTGHNNADGKTILIKNVKEVYNGLTKTYVNCDKIVGNLFLRTKKEGDKFKCIGRNVTTKLSKLLKNDGISPDKRDSLAVIVDSNDNVVFVEGYGANETVKPTKESRQIISIEILTN